MVVSPAAVPPAVSAVAAALACVPRTLKLQQHSDAHAKDVVKLRWHAAFAAAPLFKEQATGLVLSGRLENVHQVRGSVGKKNGESKEERASDA
jgi:hypothetical protein